METNPPIATPQALDALAATRSARLILVFLHHAQNAKKNRDEYLQAAQNAGCLIFHVCDVTNNFAFITPAGLVNPLDTDANTTIRDYPFNPE
ncbi:hypothetical protein N0V94_005513 [Neodidymelliopsis sp. IMI 364377]|nr:hypothetical protein N0V94_005513 [Neodidymelliopsis sp. IMI 364377]